MECSDSLLHAGSPGHNVQRLKQEENWLMYHRFEHIEGFVFIRSHQGSISNDVGEHDGYMSAGFGHDCTDY